MVSSSTRNITKQPLKRLWAHSRSPINSSVYSTPRKQWARYSTDSLSERLNSIYSTPRKPWAMYSTHSLSERLDSRSSSITIIILQFGDHSVCVKLYYSLIANCWSQLTVSKYIGAGETTYFRETLPTTSGISVTAGVNHAIDSVAFSFLNRVMHTMGSVF